jgi:tRNA pseudouridine55 synthase
LNAPRRAPRRVVDGVLHLDKPLGLSSNGALQSARRLYNAAKAGHTGTLDPLATGLLPLCFGEATKFASALLDADKEYAATLQLGVVTDTGDAEGAVLQRRPVNVTQADVDAVLPRLTGAILQIPPMHSALKRDGKPLYAYARAGIEVERKPRPVTIHHLQSIAFAGDRLSITVGCSKGTYVRTLAEDIGNLLGCGAHLTALRRTRIGRLEIADAVTLDRLEQCAENERIGLLEPVDSLLVDWPAVMLEETAATLFRHGQIVACLATTGGLVRVHFGTRFLGLGDADGNGQLRPKRLVAS